MRSGTGRSSGLRILVACAAFVHAAAAGAYTTRVVAHAGTTIAPPGATFVAFAQIPTLNDAGQVAFAGQLALGPNVIGPNDTAFFRSEPDGSLALLVREEDSFAGPGAYRFGAPDFFPFATAPIDAAGAITFAHALTHPVDGRNAGPYGVFDASGASAPSARVLAGGTLPGSAGVHRAFTLQDVTRAGDAALVSSFFRVGSVDGFGLWSIDAEGVATPVFASDAPPAWLPTGTPPSFVEGRIDAAGRVAFMVALRAGIVPEVTSENDRFLATWEPGGASALLVREGDPAPGAPPGVRFRDPRLAAIDDAGRVVVQSFTTAGGAGVWESDGVGVAPIVLAGDPAPGFSGRTLLLDNSAVSAADHAGSLAITGTAELAGSPPVQALYERIGDGPLALVAATGQPVLGVANRQIATIFRSTVSRAPGHIAFVAADIPVKGSGSIALSLFAHAGGALQRIVGSGDVLEVAPGELRTVLAVNPLRTAMNESGQIACFAYMSDGSQAILLATP